MAIVEKYLNCVTWLDSKALVITRANNGDRNAISLQNTVTGLFLRHKEGKIVETGPDDNPDFFAMDSSFIPEDLRDGFVLRCANEGMADSFVCKIDADTFIVNPDLVEYVFRAHMAPAGPAVMGAMGGLPAGSTGWLGRSIAMKGQRYLTVPANDGDAGHVSLLNAATGHFARHFCGEVIESGSEMAAESFAWDSSFRPEQRGDGMILYCVNAGMENVALCKGGEGQEGKVVVGDVAGAWASPSAGANWPWEALKALVANSGRIVALLENLAMEKRDQTPGSSAGDQAC